MVSSSEKLPRDYWWNFIVLTGDAGAYFVAISFVDLITVLPLFFQSAYESLKNQHPGAHPFFQPALLAGLALGIRRCGWLLPQFFSARAVSAGRRKKAAVLLACWIGRLPVLLVALYLSGAFFKFDPAAAVILLLVVWTLFSVSEGMSGAPWMTLVSLVIPERRRGRLFGAMQIAGGVLACGAGVVVSRLLGKDGPPFPQNFAILFGGAFAMLMVSQTFLYLIREPEAEGPEPPAPPLLPYLRQLPELVGSNRPFRLMLGVQILGSLGDMAAPLYILFALNRLHAPASMAGFYLSVTMAGTVIGSLIWGWVNDHGNPQVVIRLNLVAAMLTPWAAWAAGWSFLRGDIPAGPAASLYAVSFFLAGVTFSGGFTGYTAYM
nr:MFS transporter [Armatimonadota bacterium]